MAHELKPISSDATLSASVGVRGLAPAPSSRWPNSCLSLLTVIPGWRLEHLMRVEDGSLEARLHREDAPETWWSIRVSPQGATARNRFSDSAFAPPGEASNVAEELLARWSRASLQMETRVIGSAEDILDALAPAFDADGTLGGGWSLRDVLPNRQQEDPRAGFVLEFVHRERADAYHLIMRSPALEGEHSVGGIGVHDYVAGPVQWPEVATVRARAMFALSLIDPPSISSGVLSGGSVPVSAPGLTSEERARFDRDGYLVVRGAVAPERVDAAREAAQWFLGHDPTLRDRWYFDIIPYANQSNLQRGGTFLEFYQHQALWDVRMDPAVYGVFRDLWGREDLWVTLDRLGYKPPRREGLDAVWRDDGCVHWDVDLSTLPLPFGVQGLVALTDAGQAHGTFQCAPGMHANLEEFSEGRGTFEGRHPGADAFEMVPIDLKAGDLLIWHHGLPHRTGPNLTDEVRLVLYLSMAPARQNEQERLERVRAWRDRLPGASLFEGDPLRREERHGVTAELTHLGQRLLGAQPWPLEEG
jgi:hypothetical protein